MMCLKSQPLDDNTSYKCINIDTIIELQLNIISSKRYRIKVITQSNTTGIVLAEYGEEGPEIYQELIRRLELRLFAESIQLPREDNIYQINKFLRKDT